MLQKLSKLSKEDEKTVTKQTLSSSDPLVIKSSKGKPITVTKIEDPVKVKVKGERSTKTKTGAKRSLQRNQRLTHSTGKTERKGSNDESLDTNLYKWKIPRNSF